MMWWIILFLLGLVQYALFAWSGTYLVELMRSFWPYIVLANIVIALLLSGGALGSLGKKSWADAVWKRRLLGACGAGLIVMAALLGSRVYQVYGDSERMLYSDTTLQSGDFSVFYANIFMGNNDMADLQEQLIAADADVIALVEFTQPHREYLSGYLQDNYDYINRRNRYIDRDGTLFASRLPVEEGKRFVSGYIDLEPFIVGEEGDQLLINVVHTASPILEVFFELRNRQLPMLAQHLRVQQEQYSTIDRQLVIGDFNVSPWSVYYQRFVDELGDEWINWSTRFGYLTTWRLPLFGFVKSHIDHAWGRGLIISGLRHVSLAGSDHDGFLLTIE